VMQSGEWTEKQTEFYGQGWHFDVVKRIVDSVKEGWFMTLSRYFLPSPANRANRTQPEPHTHPAQMRR
jgi:hypothetical protein